MADRIILTDYFFPDITVEKDILAKAGAELEYIDSSATEDIIRHGHDAVGIITQYVEIEAAVFEQLPNLEFVAVYGIGVDTIDVDAATDHGVAVLNTPDYCVEEVANHAVCMVLAAHRRLVEYHEHVQDGGWDWEIGRYISRLSNNTVGIVGLGRIGRQVAQRLSGFGVDLISYDPYISADEMNEYGVEKVSFDTLCTRSNIITVHTPLDDETAGMIDTDAINRMGDDTILVNAARGGIIDEGAVQDALERDELHCIGLDVLADEPPSNHGLIGRDDVIFTPHVAWYSEGALNELQRSTAENAAAVIADGAYPNIVNPDAIESS